jgi:GT2 family glycosyltransferase
LQRNLQTVFYCIFAGVNRISIITICFNNRDELVDTCKSIDEQREKPWEHLIIDGSATPDIRRFLEDNPQPVYRKWICEPDEGIADAFNKGIRHATGDILVMLNSGDRFFNDRSLEEVSAAFRDNPGIQWLHARYKLQRSGQEVIIGKPFAASKLYRGMRSICHQTMYVRKELFDKYGAFDTNLRIAMDYDFLIRIRNEPFLFLPEPIVVFAPQGISSAQYTGSLEESSKVFRKYFSNSFLHRVWQLRLRVLHFLLQSPIGTFLYRIKTKLKLENM